MKRINRFLQERLDQAIEVILEVAMQYSLLVVGYSGGKDSSVLLDVTLKALQIAKSRGLEVPKLVVHTNNTGVENPEIRLYVMIEFEKIRAFADAHGLDVELSVGNPTLGDHWAVSLFTGRKLPTYPDKQTADCSMDYKIKPGAKKVKSILKTMGLKLSDALFLLGTRLDESDKRRKNMEARGESHESIAKNKKTGDSFAPIATWMDEEVWSYLIAAGTERVLANGMPMQGFSNFEETNRIYADAQDEGCHLFGDPNQKRGGCGARHGCWSCSKVSNNASLQAMVDKDPKYAYMRPLLNIQKFIVATQYNWEYRNPIGRTLSVEGTLNVQPDTLHPSVIEKLFLACLTVDRDNSLEGMSRYSLETKVEPILTLERIAYIDAIWSLRGFFEPYHAWKLAADVYGFERSFYFDDHTDKVAKTPIPKKRYLDISAYYDSPWANIGERFWNKTFSVRMNSCFLEDGDFYDSTEENSYCFQDGYQIPTSHEERLDMKLSREISIDLTNLGFFLHEKIDHPATKIDSLWDLPFAKFEKYQNDINDVQAFNEDMTSYTPVSRNSDTAYGRCQGFKDYLDFGIVKYSKNQKRWIENAVELTLGRKKALGQWDIPTYSECIKHTLPAKPESVEMYIPEEKLENILEDEQYSLAFDFSELDSINVTVIDEPVKRVRRASQPSLADRQTSMF